MHPLIAYDLATSKMADLQAEADRERLARAARPARKRPIGEPGPRWALHRLFAKFHLAGSGA
jgi:hypothetical protein